jgi:uncharacterized protein YwlG (UPF0340 family)
MSRTRKRTLRSLALAATVSALAAPTASALPGELVGGGPSANEPPATPVRVVTVETDAGFDLGDAAIGAGSGFALVLIGVGAAVAVRHRPGRSALAS